MLNRDKIISRVAAKLNLMEKLKRLNPFTTKYKDLTVENAIKYTKERSKDEGFDFPLNIKVKKHRQFGDSIIDVTITETDKGNWFSVWHDKIKNELVGTFKERVEKPTNRFKPTPDDIKDFVKTRGYRMRSKAPIKKDKLYGEEVLLVEVTPEKQPEKVSTMVVWYDPLTRGLHGERVTH